MKQLLTIDYVIKDHFILLVIFTIIIIISNIASAYNLYKGGNRENWHNIAYAGFFQIISIISILIIVTTIYIGYNN